MREVANAPGPERLAVGTTESMVKVAAKVLATGPALLAVSATEFKGIFIMTVPSEVHVTVKVTVVPLDAETELVVHEAVPV